MRNVLYRAVQATTSSSNDRKGHNPKRTLRQAIRPIIESLETRSLLASGTEIPITYTVPVDGYVSLNVYNNQGAVLRELVRSQKMTAGTYTATWDGLDYRGNPSSTGSYTWKSLVNPGFSSQYVTTLGTNGQQRWDNFPGSNATVGAIAVDSTGIYLHSGASEGQDVPNLIKLDPAKDYRQVYRRGPVSGGQLNPVEAASTIKSLVDYGIDELIASGPDGSIKRWRAADGQYLGLWTGPGSRPQTVAPGQEPLSYFKIDANRQYTVQSYRQTTDVVVYKHLVNGGSELASRQLGTSGLSNVTAVAIGDDNTIYAIATRTSDSKIGLYKMTFNGATIGAPQLVLDNLQETLSIDVDPAGNVLLAERGTAMQVKRVSPTGTVLNTYGQLGGRPKYGAYQPSLGFAGLRGITARADGGFVVNEQDVAPLRQAIYNKDGQIVREFYGGGSFVPQAFPDPATPNTVWMDSQYNSTMKLAVDNTTGLWSIQEIYETPTSVNSIFGAQSTVGGAWRPLTRNGVQYLVRDDSAQVVKVDSANRRLVPMAAYGPNSFLSGAAGITLSGNSFAWADADGQGDVDQSELQFSSSPGYLGPFSSAAWSSDFTFYGNANAAGPAYAKISVGSWNAIGAPVFNLPGITFSAGLPPELLEPGYFSPNVGLFADDLSNVYSAHHSRQPADGQYEFYGYPFNEDQDTIGMTRLIKYNSSGQLVWSVGRHNSSTITTPRGEIGAIGNIAGGVVANDFAGSQNRYVFLTQDLDSLIDVYDGDGLLAGRIFDNTDPNGAASHVFKLQEEGTYRGYTRQFANGDVYYYGSGPNDVQVFKVTGWGNIRRASGTVAVSTAPNSPAKAGNSKFAAFYYNNATLSGSPTAIRLEDKIDYRAAEGKTPFGGGAQQTLPAGITAPQFSARYVTQIEPQISETYTFYLRIGNSSTAGARLWVDDQLVIDNWNNQLTLNTDAGFAGVPGQISLVAGRQYKLKVEWKGDTGAPLIHLKWASPSMDMISVKGTGVYGGLVADWNFNETSGNTRADESGWGRTLTLAGGYASNHGRMAAALNLTNTGGSAAAEAPVILSSTQSALTGLSVSGWIYSRNTTGTRTLVARADSGATGWQVGVKNGQLWSNLNGEDYAVGTISANTWTHVAITWNGTTVRYYINGTEVGGAGVSSLNTAGSKTLVGSLASSQYFDGLLDGLQVHDRAVSGSEVADFYDYGNTSTVRVVATDARGSENGADGGVVRFSRNGRTDNALTVNYTLNGTATAGGDYTSPGSSVVIAANNTFTDVPVSVLTDATAENEETIRVTASNGSGFAVDGARRTGTIFVADSDRLNSNLQAWYRFEDAPGSAIATDSSGKNRTLALNGAAIDSATGKFGNGAVWGGAQRSLTSVFDESNGMSFAGWVNWRSGGGLTASLVSKESEMSTTGYAINVSTVGSSLIYSQTANEFTGFDAPFQNFAWTHLGYTYDQLTRTVSLYVNGALANSVVTNQELRTIGDLIAIGKGYIGWMDEVRLYDRTLTAADMSAVYNYNPGSTGPVQVTITANDARASEAAGNGGQFTVTRTGATTAALVVNYAINGTATNGTDYTSIPTSVTIPIGASSAVINITPTNDASTEGGENVTLKLLNGAGYVPAYVASAQTASVTIKDDEVATNRATFAGTDVTTRGFWQGHNGANAAAYGKIGRLLPGLTSATPTRSQIIPETALTFTNWETSGNDARSPQVPDVSDIYNLTEREVGAWQPTSGTEMTFDIYGGAASSAAQTLSLYFLDLRRQGLRQTVELLDGTTGATLDTRTVSRFGEGKYLSWEIVGHVKVRITGQFSQPPQVSGVFLDPAPTKPVITVVANAPNASEAGTNPGQFTLTRTGDVTNPLTVTYRLGGTASGTGQVASGPFASGTNPFANIAGTGTATHNGNQPISSWTDWSDRNINNVPGVARDRSQGPLWYEERWTSAKSVEMVWIETADRTASGNIYAATTPGGPLTTLVGTFNVATIRSGQRVAINQTGIYGLKVEVTGGNDPYWLQLAEVAFYQKSPGTNLAPSATTTYSAWTGGNVSDEAYGWPSYWQGNGGTADNWVALNWTASQAVQYLRVVSDATAGASSIWSNFDVQVKQAGVWSTVGRVNLNTARAYHWVDLGTPMQVEGVRLYGSNAGGNNPLAQGLINDIAVFGPAGAGADYQAPSYTVTFGGGQRTAVVNLNPLDDILSEGDESVVLVPTDPTNGSYLSATEQAVVILHDNDAVPVTASMGANPFVNIAGTGTATTNAINSIAYWTDKSIWSADGGRGPVLQRGGANLYYQETWATARNASSVYVESSDRTASGVIYVATTPGGPVNVQVGTFNLQTYSAQRVGINQTGIYGVRVEVTGSTDPYWWQLAEVEIWSQPAGPNLAPNGTVVRSGSGQRNGSVIDNSYLDASLWQANPEAFENFIGVEFATSQTVRGVRVSTSAYYGSAYAWRDFDVQVKRNGVWSTVGRASMPTNTSSYWVDFGASITGVEGIRLYGAEDRGNNPTAQFGLLVDDIAVF